ncbi:MAG: VanZ family protein [Methylocystaceae bacterium]
MLTKKTLFKTLILAVLFVYFGVVIYSAVNAEGIKALFGINNATKENLHFIEFALLYLLIIAALAIWGQLSLLTIVLVAIICLGAGVLDEYHQTFVPGRTASYFDVFKDGVGIFFVWYIVSLCYLRRHQG